MIIHDLRVIFSYQFLGLFAAVFIGQDAINFAVTIVFFPLLAEVMVLLDKLIIVLQCTLTSQLSVQEIALTPKHELHRLVGIVLESVIDVIILHRRACAKNDSPSLIGCQRIGMRMKFRHGHGTVQYHAMDGICQVTKPAAQAHRQAVSDQNSAFLKPLAFGAFTDRHTERKGLARTDDDAVDFLTREANIDRLILLSREVNTGCSLDHIALIFCD